MYWYHMFSVLSFAWGACIGSFLNVCIYRIPNELSIVTPRSYCPHCKKTIPWYLNMPLVSWPMLAGRCRFCRERISPRYLLVELLTAVLFLLVWLKLTMCPCCPRPLGLAAVVDWKLIPIYWLAIWGLILGTFVDFEHMIIPDRVTLGGIVAGFILSGIVPSLHGQETWLRGLMFSSLGIALGWGLLWGMGALGKLILKKDAMGFGDVKLLGAIGAFFGWQCVLFTIFVSSLVGSIVGIALVVMRRKEMQSKIPYGPYIALAAVIWMLWGPTIWEMYTDLLFPPTPYL